MLRSNWTIPQVLAELSGVRRIDDAIDLLAFRVAGSNPTRTVYVYLYGGDPDLISFDLEDETESAEELDHTVRRGHTRSLNELRSTVLEWLGGPQV